MKPRKETNYIVIHCSDTKADQNITAEDIRRWHVEENGWSDIGYHWIIQRDGKIEAGRNIELKGAHVAGHNHESVGICMVGGMAEDGGPCEHYTSAQWIVLEMLVETLQLRYPSAQVVGHYFFNPYKTCPNFIVEQWLENIQ